jgi:hypothetical protein
VTLFSIFILFEFYIISIKSQSVMKDTIATILVEHSNKMSLLTLRKWSDDFTSRLSNKKPAYGFIQEPLLTVHMSMCFKKYSRMNRVFNIKIDQLIQSGIVQRFLDAQFADTTKIAKIQKEEEKKEDPMKLTTQHLELCFYAVLIGLALSCVVFVFEVVIGFLLRF